MLSTPLRERARSRLTVVESRGYSPLPHAVIRSPRLSRDAKFLYAVLQMHWWRNGECCASHGTLADEMACSLRALRGYLDELIAAGLIVERAAGVRRAKVYAPTDGVNTSFFADCPSPNTSESADCTGGNASESADCPPSNASESADWGVIARFNRQKTTVQSAKNDTVNTSEIADSKKKNVRKKKIEEQTTETTSPPSVPAPPSKKTFVRCPDDFAPTDEAIRWAIDKHAVTRSWLDEQTLRFVDYWTGTEKGAKVKRADWNRSWMTWMDREAERLPQQRRAGGAGRAAGISPVSSSEQRSKWADRGGVVVGRGGQGS